MLRGIHSVDISSVLYWGWSPGVCRTSHALYPHPRTFPLIHISTRWSSKAIYGHPRNSKLEVSSTSLLTTESWLDFLNFPLSAKLPGEWSFLRSLHFCFLSCTMVSCMVTSPSWLFKEKRIYDSWCLKGCPSVIFSVTRWVWRETGTDSESHTREEHLLSLAFPLPFSPEALVWGLDNLTLGMPSSHTTCPSQGDSFLNSKNQDHKDCWLRPWCVFEECLLTLCVLFCHTPSLMCPSFGAPIWPSLHHWAWSLGCVGTGLNTSSQTSGPFNGFWSHLQFDFL